MSAIGDSQLSNKDLAPTGVEERTWGTYNLAALWVGLSIVITTYTLASGLIAAGMTWWQGLLTVSLGNFIVLVPILLNQLPSALGIPISTAMISHIEFMLFGVMIVLFLIAEPHGLARLWAIAKEKLRLWPFPY